MSTFRKPGPKWDPFSDCFDPKWCSSFSTKHVTGGSFFPPFHFLFEWTIEINGCCATAGKINCSCHQTGKVRSQRITLLGASWCLLLGVLLIYMDGVALESSNTHKETKTTREDNKLCLLKCFFVFLTYSFPLGVDVSQPQIDALRD